MDQDDQRWLERLLRRLKRGKEKRWVEWREDMQQHLINALQTPGMSVKPNNMPAGIWYWVSEVGAGETKGFCLLVMVAATVRIKSESMSQMKMGMAEVLGSAGYRYSFGQHVPVGDEGRPFLHHNTRRLARRVNGRTALYFSVFRVRFWKEAANLPP